MKLMESTKEEGNKSAITANSERSEQGGRKMVDQMDTLSLVTDKPGDISLHLTNNKALPKLSAL